MSVKHFGKQNAVAEPSWYRQFWPWFLVFFPLSAVVGGMITIYLAIESDDGLVEDDYYKRGLAINADLAKDQRASELGLQATIDFIEGGTARVVLDSTKMDTPPLMAVRLYLVHPTRADRDQDIALEPAEDGSYHGEVATPETAYWNVRLQTEGEEWRLTGRAHLPEQRRVRLVSTQGPWHDP